MAKAIPVRRARCGGLLLLAAAALLPGCISRKLFIRSEPSGATVVLDGRRLGVTPFETDFPAYGTRRLVLELPGHEHVEMDLVLATPWYEYFPMDMLTELAWPGTVRDHRHYLFTLSLLEPSTQDWAAAEEAFRGALGSRPAPPAEEED